MSSLDGLCLKSIGYLLPTEKEIGKKERCTSLMKDISPGMVRCGDLLFMRGWHTKQPDSWNRSCAS